MIMNSFCYCFALLLHTRLCEGAGSSSISNGQSISTAANDLIQPAANWLLERSKQSGSWGVDTPRALLALLRVAADRSAPASQVWDANSLQGLILRQGFDIQLLLFILRFSIFSCFFLRIFSSFDDCNAFTTTTTLYSFSFCLFGYRSGIKSGMCDRSRPTRWSRAAVYLS